LLLFTEERVFIFLLTGPTSVLCTFRELSHFLHQYLSGLKSICPLSKAILILFKGRTRAYQKNPSLNELSTRPPFLSPQHSLSLIQSNIITHTLGVYNVNSVKPVWGEFNNNGDLSSGPEGFFKQWGSIDGLQKLLPVQHLVETTSKWI